MHWRFSPTARFYEAHASTLSLSAELQDHVISVYNGVFTARADIEAVNSEAFSAISDEGRESGLRWRYEELQTLSWRIGAVLSDMRRFQPTGLKLPKDGEST